MRKFLSLIVIAIFISACASNTPQPNPISDANQIATIVAGTLSAMNAQTLPTEIPATPTPPIDSLSIDGQLQGTLAFIRCNNLWISINGVETQLTNDADPTHTGAPELWYSDPKISPDGAKIAHLKKLSYRSKTLIVSNVYGGNLVQISDVTWAEWSNDSQRIYYPVSNGFDVTTGLETIIVKSINPITGEFQEHGQFGVRQGCGGGSSDPSYHISSSENIIGTLGLHVLDLSPHNSYIIHPTICSSGLGLFDLSTKQDRTLDDSVRGGVFSPDGSKIAAASDNNIVIFNVITGGIESTFPTSETPRALLWGADGKEVLYSTSILANKLSLDDNVAFDLFGSSPISYDMNVSTLWIISLENGQSKKIIETEAYDLKPIFTNGQNALVVEIENANKLFAYVSQGNSENLEAYYPTSNIIEVDLTNSSSNSVTNNTQQASFFK